jgi:hypothetical protein
MDKWIKILKDLQCVQHAGNVDPYVLLMMMTNRFIFQGKIDLQLRNNVGYIELCSFIVTYFIMSFCMSIDTCSMLEVLTVNATSTVNNVDCPAFLEDLTRPYT